MSNVPVGYKQTDVGVIPEDWEVKPLGEVLKIRHGKSQHEVICRDGKYPILATGGEIGRTNTALYSKPSVLIGRKGTIDVPRFMDSPFWTVDTLFFSELSDKVEPKFIFYKFCLVDWYSYNEASGVPSLNAATIEKIPQPLPPTLTEQTAIATALSDVDALLNQLDKLIAKKRDIKQATMQQLLTGKKRLAGFSGEWEVKKLGDICDVRDGTHESPKFHNQGVPFVTSKNIINGCIDFSDISFISELDAINFNKRSKVDSGDILMSMIGTIGNAVLIDFEPDFCVKNVALIKPFKINAHYLIQLIQSSIFQDYLSNSLDGGIQKFISLGTLRCLLIQCPTFEEQTAIATLLTDMDNEITQLQQRRHKTHALKQGMMQQLLTGKIRLVS